MKKSLLNAFVIFSMLLSTITQVRSQAVVADLNFDGYVGTAASAPAGYYFSWHSTTSNSFYTSSGNFGVASPSYKFGNDGDFIVTPFIHSADSLRFWSKGNGAPFSLLNEIRIYYSADSVNWTLDASIVPLSISATLISVPLNQVSGYVKIEYYKTPSGGNLAFDDLKIYSTVTSLNSAGKKDETITVFPSPTTGILKIRVNDGSDPVEVEVYDMLGNAISDIAFEKRSKGLYYIDLTGKSRGLYFVKVKTANQFITRRITLTN